MNESSSAIFKLKGDEEFLEDHFKGFPVMPGVLLLEMLKQTAASLLSDSQGSAKSYRLVEAQDVKFGQFVRPGSVIKASARLVEKKGLKHFFEGRLDLVESPSVLGRGKVLSACFQLAPVE